MIVFRLVLWLGFLGMLGIESVKCQQSNFDDYNITWSEQSKNSAASMPVGGGDIGCNVWVENGELLMYVQRSGSLAETNEYLKLGRIRLRLSPNPFSQHGPDSKFRQQLKLHDGYVEIQGEKRHRGALLKAKIDVWVDVDKPVVHIEIEANRKIQIDAAYENWRIDDQIIPDNGRRHSSFTLDRYPGEVILSKDQIIQEDNGIVFYHRNPDNKLVPDMLITQQGLEKYKDEITDDLIGRTFGGVISGKGLVASAISQGEYQGTPFKAWHLVSKQPEKYHHIQLVSHIAQTHKLEDWEKDLNEINALVKTQNLKQTHQAAMTWWHKFWDRSYIMINPDAPDEMDKGWVAARNYQLFRYQLGCNVFGEYPTKFNGGNFTVDAGLIDDKKSFGPDFRSWGGGVFTAQNQRLIHWPMLKTGDFDAILPHFELYRKALPGARARVKAHFGHDGAVYSEYANVPGIALGAGYGWSRGARGRGEETRLGDKRADASKGYNSVVEKGVMANQNIAYHWESQLENAYMILEYHRYTGEDISKYTPFIKQSLIFFDEHYRMREKMRNGEELDKKGKLVIFPSTSCETYRGAKNPIDVIAGLQACLASILTLGENYISASEKRYYEDYLERLPGYYYNEIKGDAVIKPAESWKRIANIECPQFYPLFPFNRFGLGKDDMTVFRNTWKHGTFPKNMVISWHQDGIFFARMGMTEKAAAYNTQKLMNSERRFPTFWGPGHDWVPDHNWGGSGMIGLQEMLMQCFGERILLFPTWPKAWDVKFKLHAPQNTTVEGTLKDGKLIDLKVKPESRRKDVSIWNKELN